MLEMEVKMMDEMWIAFGIWAIIGLLFVGVGIYSIFSKKAQPMGFWANAMNNLPMAELYFLTSVTSNIFAFAQNPIGCGFFVKNA